MRHAVYGGGNSKESGNVTVHEQCTLVDPIYFSVMQDELKCCTLILIVVRYLIVQFVETCES